MRISRRSVLSGLACLSLLPPRVALGAEAGLAVPKLQIDIAARRELFDLARLDAQEQRSFSTATLWTQGASTFSGPPLAAVLKAAGVGSWQQMAATALNDYSVNFTPDDLDADFPIIATRRNGRTFDAREMGPLWIVYPYDHDARYRTEMTYLLSIWQVVRLQVKEGLT